MNKRFFLAVFCALFALGGWASFLHVTNWLAVSQEPRKADIIICLNGNLKRVSKVVELFNRGYGETILATFPATREAIIKAGVPETAVVSLDGGYNSTYEEALQGCSLSGAEGAALCPCCQ